MRKIFIIMQREYVVRVRKRAFFITTLLIPLVFAGFTTLPILFARSAKEDLKIAVIDKAGLYKWDSLRSTTHIHFEKVETGFDSLRNNFEKFGYDAVVFFPENFNIYTPDTATFVSAKQVGFQTQEIISGQIMQLTRTIKLAKLDLTAGTLHDLNLDKEVPLTAKVMGADGEKKGNAAAAAAIGSIAGFGMYIILLIYGMMVMRGVMEEKTSRIVEVIISSVKPFQLMMGKVLGIALVGLTQFAIWIVLMMIIQSVILSMFGAPNPQDMQGMASQMGGSNGGGKIGEAVAMLSTVGSSINIPLVIGGLVYFFLAGYLMYAALFAAVGSMVNEDGEGTQLSFIVTFPIIISVFIMISVIDAPDSTTAVVASLIPFSAPIVMPARLAYDPPLWQIVCSMLSVAGGFLLTTWFAGRVYRTAILMYGKKPTIKEMFKWAMRSGN